MIIFDFLISAILIFLMLSLIRIGYTSYESKSFNTGYKRSIKNLKSIFEEVIHNELNEPSFYLKAQIELESENLENAEDYIEEYILLNKYDKRSVITLSQILILRNKYSYALQLIQSIYEDEEIMNIYNNMGQIDKLIMACYKMTNKKTKAKQYLELFKSKNGNPSSLKAINRIYKYPQLIKGEISAANTI